MRRSIAAAIALLFLAVPASAQSFEMGGLVGFTPSASLDRHAAQLDGTSIDGGVTFGIDGAAFFSQHFGVEGEWAQQFSGFSFETKQQTGDTSVRLYDITIAHLHAHAVYRFGDSAATMRPFVFGGGGATFFSAHDLETETKMSLGFGGGLIYALSQAIAIEGRVAYRPIMMKDSSAGDFCDAFGYCQSTLQQFDFLGGVKIRF
jgi:opacity protein-like surface antigen